MVRGFGSGDVERITHVREVLAWERYTDVLDVSSSQFDCQAAKTLAQYVDRLQEHVGKASPKRRPQALIDAQALLAKRYWFARQDSEREHRDRVGDDAGRLCTYGVWLSGMAWLMDAEASLAPPRLPVTPERKLREDADRLYGIAIGERYDEDD